MNRSEFEDWLQRDGYELRQGEIKPDEHRPEHVHPFDARLFILDGALTLVRGQDRTIFKPGDVCDVPANTPHEEHTEADGVRYLAGRRMASRSDGIAA
jgi:quercetin dioxygenase-like cupin family protein